ncbi:hypothetical protein H4Q26_012977 [Puccinia striiformis f. sp. tritici PST-130]|nr:hypothetical protein H4Q26_012977 [Puccinia striiformis f. sp. tritici PST-130]
MQSPSTIFQSLLVALVIISVEAAPRPGGHREYLPNTPVHRTPHRSIEITAIKPRSVHCRSTLVGCSLSPERLQSNTKTRRMVGWAARWGSKSFESDGDEESPSDLSILSNNPAETSEHHSKEEKHSAGSQPTSDGKTGSTSQPPADVLKTLCGSFIGGGDKSDTKTNIVGPWIPRDGSAAPPKSKTSIGDSHVKPNATGSASDKRSVALTWCHHYMTYSPSDTGSHNGSAPGEKPHSHGDGKIIPSPSPSPSAVGSKEIPKVLSEDSDVEDMDLDDDEEAPEQESVTDENFKVPTNFKVPIN